MAKILFYLSKQARRIQKAGAIAGIVLDNVLGSSAAESPMFAMSGDGKEPDDITIPVVFLFSSEVLKLVIGHVADNSLSVTIGKFFPCILFLLFLYWKFKFIEKRRYFSLNTIN